MTPSKASNPKFFVLQTGDKIKEGDEYYNPVCDKWLPVQDETIGDEWSDDESKPVRRKARIEAMTKCATCSTSIHPNEAHWIGQEGDKPRPYCNSCNKLTDTATCKRCGCYLDDDGKYCTDETCPHSDFLQHETWSEG